MTRYYSFYLLSVGVAKSCLWVVCTLFTVAVTAEQLDKTSQRLLDEAEYRTGIEEVVVVGKQPQWRQVEKEQWLPERFELSSANVKASRIQWLPKYNKDERDNYQGVRDRTGESAEIKLFELKF
ncbi:MAG: hypothetical protein JKY66_07955 [Spongiibacteraceae bacterium]|nr:hypothetical protein [Spongiibacteraceae bacterium]